MRLAGKILVHQVHPAKIGADVTASMVSNVLFVEGAPEARHLGARLAPGRWLGRRAQPG
jgi:hypothetical protein